MSSALDAGAGGYLVKDCTTSEIVDAVNRVAHGERVIAPSVAGTASATAAAAQHATRPSRPPLSSTRPLISKREEEVLRLMATGVSIPEAARRLFISVKTVKNHLSSIYQKLDSHDRAQAVLKAMRMGLIRMD